MRIPSNRDPLGLSQFELEQPRGAHEMLLWAHDRIATLLNEHDPAAFVAGCHNHVRKLRDELLPLASYAVARFPSASCPRIKLIVPDGPHDAVLIHPDGREQNVEITDAADKTSGHQSALQRTYLAANRSGPTTAGATFKLVNGEVRFEPRNEIFPTFEEAQRLARRVSHVYTAKEPTVSSSDLLLVVADCVYAGTPSFLHDLAIALAGLLPTELPMSELGIVLDASGETSLWWARSEHRLQISSKLSFA